MFFAAANIKWRLSIQNETGAPFRVAHNATIKLYNGYLHKETVHAISNLATATPIDHSAIAHITATVASLMTEFATVNVKLVVVFQTNRTSRGGHGARDRTGCGHISGAGAGASTGTGASTLARTGASAPSMAKEKDMEPPIRYCWTCGPGCRHNSAKCPVPSTGHTATNRNIQGWAEATK